jgi:lysophospholipase L1-like esterase
MTIRNLLLALGVCTAAAVAQGLQLRRKVPRLPAPKGDLAGTRGRGQHAVRLLVIGDSSAVGIGANHSNETLAAHIAALYSLRAQCLVHWSAIGKSGATLDELRSLLIEQPPHLLEADVVVVAIGVNDVLKLRSPLRWRRSLRALIELLPSMTRCERILLSPIPPLWKFSLLPVPLRYLLGAQALALDLVSRTVADGRSSARHLRIPLLDQTTMLCEDRLHPSSIGYKEWARHVAQAMVRPDAVNQARGNASTFAAQMKSF